MTEKYCVNKKPGLVGPGGVLGFFADFSRYGIVARKQMRPSIDSARCKSRRPQKVQFAGSARLSLSSGIFNLGAL